MFGLAKKTVSYDKKSCVFILTNCLDTLITLFLPTLFASSNLIKIPIFVRFQIAIFTFIGHELLIMAQNQTIFLLLNTISDFLLLLIILPWSFFPIDTKITFQPAKILLRKICKNVEQCALFHTRECEFLWQWLGEMCSLNKHLSYLYSLKSLHLFVNF